MSPAYGKVYLVGAGPGDPGLLTLRAKEVLEHADVVIYDKLVNEAVLAHAPRAEHIFVGKSTDRHTLPQEDIIRVLIEQAARVQRVVRLKGGDPFVFGRGGEEALALAEKGIAFEVVPGVTAGVAAPAYAGIPITHRGEAASYSFITGHGDADATAVDLSRLAVQGTLCFYMGVKNLPSIVDELLRLGRAPETPVAAIEWGTYPRQRSIVGTLQDIVARVTEAVVQAPAIIVVGEVVRLHERIGWFESRPLYGLRIVVTRARAQAGELSSQLRELGADVFEFPAIQIEPPESPPSFRDIGTYDWVILTSVNAVEMLFERLDAEGFDARNLAGVKLCAIGSSTARALNRRYLRVDLVPEEYVAEALLEALLAVEPSLEGKRFLLPRADIARSFLPEALRQNGAEVTEVVTYRTVTPTTNAEIAEAMLQYEPHLIVFMSSSAVRNFREMVGEERVNTLVSRAAFASIGPKTTETAREFALPIGIEPARHDIPALVDAIAEWGRSRSHRIGASDRRRYDSNVAEPAGPRYVDAQEQDE